MKKAWSISIVLFALFVLAPYVYAQGRFTVTVTVVDDSGDLIPGASVNIVNVSGDRSERFSGTSDGNGVAKVRVETIFGGDFEVRVDKPLFIQGKAGFRAAGNWRDKDISVEVTLQDNAAATEIFVHVTDQATGYKVYGASVTLTGRLSSSAYQSGSTDSNGDARFYINKSGSYTIRVSSSIFEDYETPLVVNEGQKNVNLSIALKKKYAKPIKNAEFVAIVKGKDEDGKVVPLKGARVQVVDQNSMADTDDRGYAYLKAEAGIGDEIRIAASANGYQPQEKVAKMSADTLGGAGGVFSIGGGSLFVLERIAPSRINFTVEVRDADTNQPIRGATVRPQVATSDVSDLVMGTDANGEAPFMSIYSLPAEAAKRGFRLIVRKEGYEEKWSDVAPELLTTENRRYTVYLKPKVDTRFVGTWRCACNYSITLNSDGTGVFTDSRGGPDGSLYASGTFNGNWTSSGNSASLTLGQEHKHRAGTFHLRLEDGKLKDQFGGVLTK